MPWTTRPSEDSNHAHASPNFVASPARDSGRTTDLNRLRPSLSSHQLNYEIPTLRRKPQPRSDPSNSSSLKHHRSFSHPIPSFFIGKKAERKHSSKQDKHGVNTNEDENSVAGDVGRAPNLLSRKPSGNASLKADRQPVTGKCMTCDSTVRWPQGLKVFRCSICLTINDLEPQIEQRSDANNLEFPPSSTSPRRRMLPIPTHIRS
jgi:E3 ubiquitin-protein ligase HECTD2